MVPKAGKYYGRLFSTGRGVTQGDPVYPKIFYIVVDTVVRADLQEVYGTQEAHHGFGWAAGEHSICFYADDGQIEGRNTIWVQTAQTAMVRMFERFGLQKNMIKTKAMICTPWFIWGHKGVGAYNKRSTGEGTNLQERKRTRVSCKECGGTTATLSL